MKNYISQLNGMESNAIHCIKKLVAAQLNALMIYCFGCRTSSVITRTAFIKRQLKEDRHFTCDLLVITPDHIQAGEEKLAEIQEMVAHFGTVNMVVHPLYFVLKHMNEGNLFFNWVHKNGMLLFDRNNTLQLLPPPVGGEYRPQAEAFYNSDPGMNNYLDVKWQPVIKREPAKQTAATQQPVQITLQLNPSDGWKPVLI
ncbi:hypothetical protein [Parafilimonas terrae]|uniref:Uncharacterized protein n=1 Tax=Parafilimonas terrae TaxID=1465490 RepID=A0A1I5V4C9_9BACT|nr:hypothetical protein [Parafilimonas terrae]SFQ02424.1 hypothetical protein SAMN05444277_104207 [Parafilimonas terrae]